MPTTRRTFIALTLAVATFAGLAGHAAQAAGDDAFPRKPLRLVIPFQGGITDKLGRLYADKLSAQLGQTVIVDTRPGAGGAIGVRVVAGAEPDGYTLVISGDNMAIKAATEPDPGFDPETHLQAVAPIMSMPFLVVTGARQPYRSLGDLVEQDKQKPGSLNYASVGPGTAADLMGRFLNREAGTHFVHVPYKGGSAQAMALMSGEVQFGFLTTAFAQPYLEAGSLRAVAIVTRERSPLFPEVASAAEAGYAGMVPAGSTWFALFAPRGLPDAVRKRLERASIAVAGDPEFKEVIGAWGGSLLPGGTAELSDYLHRNIVRWKDLAKQTATIADAGVRKQ